jgi:hypothetical protein
MTIKYRITSNHAATLANICAVAMERFLVHAKSLDEHAKADPVDGQVISPGLAARMRDQFSYQAAQAQHLSQVFQAFDGSGVLEVDEEMIEDIDALGGNGR